MKTIKLIKGKGYIVLRIGNLGLGIGRPDEDLRSQVDRTRPARGI